MARMIYARRTAGGRCCSFKGKHNTTTIKGPPTNSKTNPGPPQHTIREQMSGTAVIMNPNIPSNEQVRQSKSQMDNLAQKLQNVKIKKQRNITFNL